MKTAPVALSNWLATNPTAATRADLYTITLLDGSTYRWTNAPYDLVSGGNTYFTAGANGPLIRRGPIRQSARLEIDTLDVELLGRDFLVGGQTLGLLAAQGWLDSARVVVDHLLMPTPGDGSLGSYKVWDGAVASVEPRGTGVALRCKSDLEQLNTLLPRFLLQPQCGNMLYDLNCGVSRAAQTLTGTVSASTSTTITTASAALTAKASGHFDLGVLQFTSGALNGVKRAVRSWNGTVFTLAVPLAVQPANGDGISVYPGCDRSYATCTGKFSNGTRYRGFPLVPAPEAQS